jgi:hypothetical protein
MRWIALSALPRGNPSSARLPAVIRTRRAATLRISLIVKLL